MLDRVIIRSFKSIEDVDLALGQINVFVGANGSGKSNLLEAIGVLGAAASGRVDDESLLRRGVRPGVPALYKSSFKGAAPPEEIGLGAFTKAASYEVELYNPTKQWRSEWSFRREQLTSNKTTVYGNTPSPQVLARVEGQAALELARLDPADPAVWLMATLRSFAIYTPDTPTLRGVSPDLQTRAPVGLHGGRLAEAIAELLERCRADAEGGAFAGIEADLLELIDWTSDIEVREPGQVPLASSIPRTQRVLSFQDTYMRAGNDVVSAYDASEGALYVLLAAALAAHPESPACLAIDNLDQGLNPRLARELMRRLCRWIFALPTPRQLLLTCHNPLVLDGLPLRDERVRLFTVGRTRRGRTLVKRVVYDEQLAARADEGWTLSRLWVMGHLGGVPDL